MWRIPLLRRGKPYRSLETQAVADFRSGEPLAELSLASSGLIRRDLHAGKEAPHPLRPIPVAELIAMTRRAARHFLEDDLPLGEDAQSNDDYLECLSRTSGLPLALCRKNQRKIHGVLAHIEEVLGGLTRGLDLSVLDRGFGEQDGRRLSYRPRARCLGAVLPSNSPGVHSLWVPAIALKTSLCLKPGREEPWSPWRIGQAFLRAGCPREALGYYPSDHAGAGAILLGCERSLLFGGASTTRPWRKDPRVQVHGPGWSKVIVGPDRVDGGERDLETMVASVVENGGRSCINASGIWTPSGGRRLAEALADRLAPIVPTRWDDPGARLAAFVDPAVARAVDASIEQSLAVAGAVDLTRQRRGGGDRLVEREGATYLLPTVIWCEDPGHPLATREYLFPFVSVVEAPAAEIAGRIGPTLVGTILSEDAEFISSLVGSPHIDRLNLGPIPTGRISWDQPHEGNLFDHLWRQRAFQHVA